MEAAHQTKVKSKIILIKSFENSQFYSYENGTLGQIFQKYKYYNKKNYVFYHKCLATKSNFLEPFDDTTLINESQSPNFCIL